MKNKTKGIYCRLIWKKGISILPRYLLTLAMTIVILAVSAALIFSVANRSRSQEPKIQVGIVVPGNDITTILAVRMVAEMDAIRTACNIQFLNDEKARAAVKSGSIQAAVFITEDIFDDVSSGANTPVLIQVGEDSGLGVQRFRDIVNVGLSLVRTGQGGMYALDKMMELHEVTEEAWDIRCDTIDNYFLVLVSRNNIWNTSVLSSYGGITMTGFYCMTGALGVVCLLFGCAFAALYDKKERAVDVCLRRMGIGVFTRSLSRLLVMTFVYWVLLFAILLPALLVTGEAVFSVPWMLGLLAGLIPAAFSAAAYTHLVYSWAVGESGSLFFLICTALLFVLGGGIFPAAYLPRGLYHFSQVLPVSFWQKYLSDLLWNGFSAAGLSGVLLYGLAMAAAGGVGLKINESKY